MIVVAMHSWQISSFFIFEKSPGQDWSAPQRIYITDPKKIDYFGIHLAVSNNTIIIGSPKEDVIIGTDTSKSAGKVYLFEELNDIWTNTAEIHANTPKANDNFGYVIDIENNTMLIAASANDFNESYADSVSNAGAVYVFTKTTNWTQTQKLAPFNRVKNKNFGRYLDFDNGNALM